MPADLVPEDAIPALAARADSSEMLRVLRRIEQAGFIHNSRNLRRDQFEILQRLAGLGLVDPGYDGPTDGTPSLWVRNVNGSRVLGHLTSIAVGPHYEILSPELAAWLLDQGKDRWWNVDGDPLLTGRRSFPCPAEDLAAQLRQINRALLVQAKKEDTDARGQTIGKEKVNDLVGYFSDNIYLLSEEDVPPWGRDRLLYLCWKGTADEWLLEEDSRATEEMSATGDTTGRGE
jgi:hypothetical protein